MIETNLPNILKTKTFRPSKKDGIQSSEIRSNYHFPKNNLVEVAYVEKDPTLHDPDRFRVCIGHGSENRLSGLDQVIRIRRFRGHLIEGIAVVKVVARTELGFVFRDKVGPDSFEERVREFEKVGRPESVPGLESNSLSFWENSINSW